MAQKDEIRAKMMMELSKVAPNVKERLPHVVDECVNIVSDAAALGLGAYGRAYIEAMSDLLSMELKIVQIDSYKIGGSNGPRMT
jgi:hypothetical protein